jgi:hypothetical protein
MTTICNFCLKPTTKPCMTAAGTVGCRLKQKADKENAEELTHHLRMMNNSDKWVQWPVLPLKNWIYPRDHGGLPALGFLVTGKGPVVHRGGIFNIEPGQKWDDFSREMFESYGALFKAGWRVD